MQRIWFILLLIAAATTTVKTSAQTEPAKSQAVKIEMPADPVIKHFRSTHPGTVEVSWTQIEDEKDIYTIGDFTLDGDQKKVIYRNNAYYCSETRIPLEYCPAGIKAAVDTLAEGFVLKELYYETTSRNKGYRAQMQKGKRKKAEYRDLMFSIKGEFLMETDPKKTVRGF